MTRDEAMRMADEAGLDLVEISPNADPPVCSIIEYGKYLFDLKQKEKAAKKNQKRVEIKELKFRPSTDDGDYNVKLRNLRRFIAEGDKVKINIRFRGREMAHQELGRAMAQRIAADLKDEATIEQSPRLEGKQMILMLAPKRKSEPRPPSPGPAPARAPAAARAPTPASAAPAAPPAPAPTPPPKST